MKLWTMLMSLVIVAVLASGVLAQDKGKKRGPGMPAWKDLVGEKTQLDKPTFVTAVVAKVTDDSKKDRAKTRAEGMWTRLAVAAGADKDKADDYVFKSEDDFKAAQAKVMASFKKGRKKGGDSSDSTTK